MYPYCADRKLIGYNCFFRSLDQDEELGDMEEDALRYTTPVSNQTMENLRQELIHYRKNALGTKSTIPPLNQLLMFAHIARLLFNRQPTVRESYRKHLVELSMPRGDPPQQQPQRSHQKHLRVSVHMRRADACMHEMKGYETAPSPMDSIAQVTGQRKCYATSVYMDSLRRIQASTNRSLEVYLSTDYQEMVLDEIETKHPDLYNSASWKLLNYSRDIYKYTTVVDDHENVKHIATVGESSVGDLWLLSHGEVFVGHLGSRFGKMGWLLATARHNHFIPFFTVDGHSFCCEIDEQCGLMREYIDSMENCLAYLQELLPGKVNEDYWEVGTMKRKYVVEMERKLGWSGRDEKTHGANGKDVV